MKTVRVCVQCGAGDMAHDVRDLPFEYRGRESVVSNVSGWFCPHCGEAYLDDTAACSDAIDKFVELIDAAEATELSRGRRKLKLTQVEAARLTTSSLCL